MPEDRTRAGNRKNPAFLTAGNLNVQLEFPELVFFSEYAPEICMFGIKLEGERTSSKYKGNTRARQPQMEPAEPPHT
jgi:hypothetical protein